MNYLINYMLFSSIILLIFWLNIDRLYRAWCDRHKNEEDYDAKKYNLRCTIMIAKERNLELLFVICLFGWVILPVVILSIIQGFFDGFKQD